MNKTEFLQSLSDGLEGLPKADIDERLDFYSEMIDDLIEDGLSEEEAVNNIGKVGDVCSQIIADIPITKLVVQKARPKRRLKGSEIALIVIGSPLWISLLAAAFAVILALFCSVWAIIISLWAVFVSLAATSVGLLFAGGILIAGKYALQGLALIGASLILGGLSVFMFFGCRFATNGILTLTKKIAVGIKKSFMRKENAK